MEGDSRYSLVTGRYSSFQSTPSAWRETNVILNLNRFSEFQSTPSAWRETREFLLSYSQYCHFNPLPPHGGRQSRLRESANRYHFNPLPPHGGRLAGIFHGGTSRGFQSTPSAWRETPTAGAGILTDRDFNPLPPHGGRQKMKLVIPANLGISIHSLRMEGDNF